MLCRAATKFANGRKAHSAFRPIAAHRWARAYSKDDRPHRPHPRTPIYPPRAAAATSSTTGPVKNMTWSPSQPIIIAPGSNRQDGTVPQDDIPRESTENGRDMLRIQDDAAPRPAAADYSPVQSEFDRVAKTKTPEQEHSQTEQPPRTKSSHDTVKPERIAKPVIYPETEVFSEAVIPPQLEIQSEPEIQTPRIPLPDLRQGIPSTFDTEYEYSDKSILPKTQTLEPAILNYTDDPAMGGGKDGEFPKDAYISSIERKRNALARYLYIAFAGFALTSAVYLGQNWESEEEAKLHPDAPNGWSPGAYYSRIKARLTKQLGYYTEPAFPKLLPEMDPNMKAPYTLVLSLEDLLVSSKWSRDKGWEVAKRPGVDYFLRYMSQYYEIVVFTSVQSMNADGIIRKLDPYRFTILWPLYREATRYLNGAHVKDLSYLNRDLSKTLIIDTVPAHVQLQPENAIILPKWDGQPAEKSPHARDLIGLIPFLEYIATMSIADVRKVLESYKDISNNDIPAEFFRRESKARELFNKQLGEEKSKRGGRSGGGRLQSALGFKPNQGMVSAVPGEQTLAEALAQGKMLSDQMRERGVKQWEMIDKEIRENGEKWLEEMAAEEKKMQDEQMKNMQGTVAGYTSKLFGMFGGDSGGGSEKK